MGCFPCCFKKQKAPRQRRRRDPERLSKSSEKFNGLGPSDNQIVQDNKQRVNQEKDIGRDFFQKSQYADAVRAYHNALRIHFELGSKLILVYPRDDYHNLSAILYANLARCHLNMEQSEEGMEFSDKAIKEDPNYIKAYVVKGDILIHQADQNHNLDQATQAKDLFEHCITLCERINKENDFTSQIEERLKNANKISRILQAEIDFTYHSDVREQFEHIFAKLLENPSLEERDKIEKFRGHILHKLDMKLENSKEIMKDDDTPEYLKCIFTHEVMQDPHTTKAGHSYSKEELLQHIQVNANEPMTRDFISQQQPGLIKNKALEKAIKCFLAKGSIC
ncbi:unnamed protein product [Moneuplotes crassus]|uniref:RING-type E3 ubiquitin transferase n=1 Tax=Euplotes crassus TaxID=5936 RepID=A0AAD1XJD9_EUPCR|nr:unnamed protein product [Moneuplotes crassus]